MTGQPLPTDLLVQVIREQAIAAVGTCICDEAYTSRRLRDPDCGWHMLGETFAEDAAAAIIERVGHPSPAVDELSKSISDLRVELEIARRDRDAALHVMDFHRCEDTAERAMRRALHAETALAETAEHNGRA